MTYVNVDIPLDDILSGMGSKEKQRLADDLFADGYYQTELEKEIEGGVDSTVSLIVSIVCLGSGKSPGL